MPQAPAGTIDATVVRLQQAAAALPARSHAELAALANACCRSVAAVADDWVATSRAAKGWTALADSTAEEWGSGPVPVARFLRLVVQRCTALARGEMPTGAAADGTTQATVPARGLGDRLLLRGVRAQLEFAVPPLPAPAVPHGDTALVLGAGNVTATALLDVIDQVFLRGRAVWLKPSPLHERLAPVFAGALAPLGEAGLLHVAGGDAAAGARLAAHPGIAAVHLTGAVATAAALRGDPEVAAKDFTAELGCVTPAFVLPGAWRDHELQHAAAQLAAFTAWNGGATCVAPRVVLTARGWPQRDAFVAHLAAALAALPPRPPFHPATREHFATATGAPAPAGPLPPTLCAGIDPVADTARFAQEHFAPVLLELPLAGDTLAAWLAAATTFARERLAGALSAYAFAPPRVLAPQRATVDAQLRALPHGTLAINTWTGLGFGLGLPWGVPAGAPWQHGIGFARDLSGRAPLRRGVVEAPFRSWPAPPWLPGRRSAPATLRALTHHYAAPSWHRLATTALHGLR